MKRLIRIELTQVAWKATVLPLNYRRSSYLRFLPLMEIILQPILLFFGHFEE